MNLCLYCLLFFITINTILIDDANASNTNELNSENELALKIISQGSNEFSSHLFKLLSNKHHGNMVCSPLSVRMVLLMTYHGSEGNTLTELGSVLRVPPMESLLKNGVKALLESLNNAKQVDLVLANKIFVHKNGQIMLKFKNITTEFYNSTIDETDFTKPEQAAKNINNWVENQTNNKIKEVVSPSDITDALMVLVNAVYFRGSWAQKFKLELTRDAPFNVNKNQTINVKTMKVIAYFNRGQVPAMNAKYIELPYKSGAVSMFIIIPLGNTKLEHVVNELHNINFTKLANTSQETELHLPKFRIESQHNLIPQLKMMGINDAFDSSARFSYILKNEKLQISNVIQEAFIDVNEGGTEAAAATASVGFRSRTRRPKKVPEFKVDSPFICVIIDKNTQTLLFMAQVTDPRKQ